MHTLIFGLLEPARYLSLCCSYETSAALVETETSTAELAQEVHNRAAQARIAAKEAALIAEVRTDIIKMLQADHILL